MERERECVCVCVCVIWYVKERSYLVEPILFVEFHAILELHVRRVPLHRVREAQLILLLERKREHGPLQSNCTATVRTIS
jgi:hypothetical protein